MSKCDGAPSLAWPLTRVRYRHVYQEIPSAHNDVMLPGERHALQLKELPRMVAVRFDFERETIESFASALHLFVDGIAVHHPRCFS
jgi:hypothetical protein